MNTSTFATVIIEAADQQAAQADFPGMFTAAYTSDPEQAGTPTHYVSSGWFFDAELDQIVNSVTWPHFVKFGEASAALSSLGMVPVQPAEENPQEEAGAIPAQTASV